MSVKNTCVSICGDHEKSIGPVSVQWLYLGERLVELLSRQVEHFWILVGVRMGCLRRAQQGSFVASLPSRHLDFSRMLTEVSYRASRLLGGHQYLA